MSLLLQRPPGVDLKPQAAPCDPAKPQAAPVDPHKPPLPPGTNLPADLIDHLQCPITHTPLRWMTPEQLADLDAAVLRGSAHHLDGTAVAGPSTAALVNQDASLVYRVEDGILMMLPIKALATDPRVISRFGHSHRPEKIAIQYYYDQVGWKAHENGEFEDAIAWEDLRPVSADYIHKCHLRVNRYLKPVGKYFLDAGSGPVQYPEYLTYSQGYKHLICMDISLRALHEARRRIGARAILILGDITRIPFRSNALDAVVSLHTIYHVPQDEQREAFEELYRVLKPGRSGVIVYSFHSAPLISLGKVPARWWRKLRNSPPTRLIRRLVGRKSPACTHAPVPTPVGAPAETQDRPAYFYDRNTGEVKAPDPANPANLPTARPPFYFKAHPLKYFTTIKWSFPLKIVAWRSVNVTFLRTYIHPRRLGKLLLWVIYHFEELCPRRAGRFGPYPMFLLRK